MTQRFICPHCHSPLDPQTMDLANSAATQLRICPNCDEPIVLTPAAAAARGERKAAPPAADARR